MTPNSKSRATVGYARISNDPMGLEAGVDRQRDDILDVGTRRGFGRVRVLTDNDITATTGKYREKYSELLAAIERGEVERVVVWHLGRLWRNRVERAQGIELCRKHEVSILCVKGPELDMTTATGRAIAGLIGEFDTMEVEIKSERQKSGNAQAARQGKPVIAKRRFGWTQDRTALVDVEADAARAAFERVLVGGSVRGIATMLNNAGLLTPLPVVDEHGNVATSGRPPRRGGREWTHSKVHDLLRNPAYAGLRMYEGELYEGNWPAVVDVETWHAVQAVLDDPDRFHNLSTARRWLGSGLWLCGVHDAEQQRVVVESNYKSRRVGLVRVYRCSKRPGHLSVKAEPVDNHVVTVVCERLSRSDARDLLVDDQRPDVDQLRAEARALRARIREAGNLWEDGTLSKGEFRERKARLQQRLIEVEQEAQHVDRAPLLADLVTAPDVRATFDAYSLERQRLVVDTLCTVTLLPPGSGRRPFDPRNVVIVPKRL